MFKELGQMAGMLRQLPKIREEMDRLQQRLGQITAEGDAGAGMVKVKVNGRMEVQSCTLSDEALKGGDKEMLEDLIRAATNQALERVRGQVAQETGKMASGLGLPPGFSIPGLTPPGMEES
jgi:DNA-binding YbaB/EbfC family protein